jgi:GntR family transcriptional regulator/MocR family aminotransferase
MPGRRWELAVSLDRSGTTPVFLQIAGSLADDVRRGRLRPGQPLPGTRRLAASLGVNRNTVVAAYEELQAEGWIETDPARGSRVSSALPDARPTRFAGGVFRRAAVPARAGYDLPPLPAPHPEGVRPRAELVFGSGVPDLRLVPVAALARAYRRALRQRGRTLLDYAAPEGLPRLRAALAGMLAATRGLAAGPDDLMITRGSQMALALVARALVQPGDLVAVEDVGYVPARAAFALAGARLAPLRVDAHGLDVEALDALARRGPVRAVYLTPHHHYPTTVTLSPGRRLRLLEVARAHRIAVVEDDYDHEFHYDGRPVLPLASVDRAGVVVYVGTLSKILAPGLRVGYVVAPAPLLARLAALRATIDTQGDPAIEDAVAELLEDGEVQRHVRRVRRIYRERRDALAELLRSELGDRVSFEVPAGGVAFWVRSIPDLDVLEWARRALAAGVFFSPGAWFAFDQRPLPFLRLGFACLTVEEIAEAVRRLARTRPGAARAARAR